MKNLELQNVGVQELDTTELKSVDGGNMYQSGIPGYGDAVRPIGAFIVGFFKELLAI